MMPKDIDGVVRRCSLCGQKYGFCKCVCPGCGEKIWTKVGGEYLHHSKRLTCLQAKKETRNDELLQHAGNPD